MHILWAIFLLPFLVSSAFGEEFSGPVVSVLDGDSVRVLHNGRAIEVRLQGIDCPEKGSPSVRERSKPPQSWSLGKKSRSKHTASIRTDTPLPM